MVRGQDAGMGSALCLPTVMLRLEVLLVLGGENRTQLRRLDQVYLVVRAFKTEIGHDVKQWPAARS